MIPNPSVALMLACLSAMAAALARHPDGSGMLPVWLELGLQVPVLIVWCHWRCHWFSTGSSGLLSLRIFVFCKETCGTGVSPVRPPAGRRCHSLVAANGRVAAEGRSGQSSLHPSIRPVTERWLTAVVLMGGIGLAVSYRRAELFGLGITLYISGNLLLDALLALVRQIDMHIDRARSVLQLTWRAWLFLIVSATILLSLPLATRSAVPDYRHNFADHILNSGYAAISSACLVGTTPYSFAEDYTLFGQGILIITSQLAGILFCAIGLSIVRPYLNRGLSLRRVLILAFGLQAVAVMIMWSFWHASDVDNNVSRLGWGLVHAGSALWNTGLRLRPDGLASYLSSREIFMCVLTLSIAGSMGLPVILDLILGRPNARAHPMGETEKTGFFLPSRRLPACEAIGVLVLLPSIAFLLFYFESPGAMPRALVPSRPFDLGENQVALRDEGDAGQRLTLAVYISGTLRSAGLQSAPVSQGALSWPSYGLLLVGMFVGGSAGGMGGGVRITAFLLLALCVVYGEKDWAAVSGGPAVRRLLLRRLPLFILAWLMINILAAIALSATSQGSAYETTFESLAGINGVGLSTDLALHLTPVGRLVMILIFVAGRWVPSAFWLFLADRSTQCLTSLHCQSAANANAGLEK